MRSVHFFFSTLAATLVAGLPLFAEEPPTAASPAAAPTAEAASTPEHLPSQVENFRLNDHLGRSHELYRNVAAPAVVLFTTGVGCPIVRQSTPLMKAIQDEFEPKGVRFFYLNASAYDTREDIAKDAEEFGVTAPVLLDSSQMITHALGATRTAEALVLDPKAGWKIVYRGAIDDRFSYGAQKAEASKTWLRDALVAQLAGQPAPVAHSQTKGCLINFAEPQKLSYSQDIAPILTAKCTTCHAAGGVAPFSMTSHQRLAKWAPMMREVIRTKQMPPWHADPAYNHFENDRSLTAEEERTLLSWLEQGAPNDEGAVEDPLASAKPGMAGEPMWHLGEPDLVVQLPQEEKLAATGIFDYRYIYVPTTLTEDRWVSAVDVQPTNAAVLHHALIFIIYPAQYQHIQPDMRGGLNGYFASFLPGQKVKPYPDNSGQFFPAGSVLVFQMHYNATGKEEVDQTRMGIYFHKEKPANALMIQAAAETDFQIPPQAPDYAVEASFKFDQPARVYGLSPHMHYRGSRARFTALYPDEKQQVLLNVPFYQFDWQPMYMFAEPVEVPANTRIHVEGAFDNTPLNPRNPGPDQPVEFGEQSWEEMFIGYVTYAVPLDENHFKPMAIEQGVALDAETLKGSKWRMGREFALTFEPDGSVTARGQSIGTWKVEGTVVHLDGFGRKIDLLIQGSDIVMEGRPLRKVDPNAPEPTPEELERERQERRERRRQREESQQQQPASPEAAPVAGQAKVELAPEPLS